MRELSKKNPYYLPKHRYLEIKNFALQYDYWKASINSIDILGSSRIEKVDESFSDPVPALVERRDLYVRNMRMVEDAADLTDDVLGYFVFLGATKACTYENLRLMHNIPCNRNIYFDKLRRFYFILSTFRK